MVKEGWVIGECNNLSETSLFKPKHCEPKCAALTETDPKTKEISINNIHTATIVL